MITPQQRDRMMEAMLRALDKDWHEQAGWEAPAMLVAIHEFNVDDGIVAQGLTTVPGWLMSLEFCEGNPMAAMAVLVEGLDAYPGEIPIETENFFGLALITEMRMSVRMTEGMPGSREERMQLAEEAPEPMDDPHGMDARMVQLLSVDGYSLTLLHYREIDVVSVLPREDTIIEGRMLDYMNQLARIMMRS
jgi:hypothetical protein